MAWLDGTYFESCSCDAVCPCTWSALTAKATFDRCRALLAYHVDSGEIDGVDVSGLSFALFLATPPVMSDGNCRVGVYLDDAASDSQAEQLGAGQLGGPPAMLGPLIGEMPGVEKAPITYTDDGRGHHVRIGDAVDVGVEDFVALGGRRSGPAYERLPSVEHDPDSRASRCGMDIHVRAGVGARRAERLFRAVLLGRVSSPQRLAWPRRGPATRAVAVLLILAAAAWAATVALARYGRNDRHDGPRPRLVRADLDADDGRHDAMMLPSVTPTASLYATTFSDHRAARTAGLVIGYLAVWAAAGVPAYGLAWLAGWLTGMYHSAAHVLAVAGDGGQPLAGSPVSPRWDSRLRPSGSPGLPPACSQHPR